MEWRAFPKSLFAEDYREQRAAVAAFIAGVEIALLPGLGIAFVAYGASGSAKSAEFGLTSRWRRKFRFHHLSSSSAWAFIVQAIFRGSVLSTSKFCWQIEPALANFSQEFR